MNLTRLLLRRYRVLIGAWTVLVIALSGATVSGYQTTYRTAEQRRTAVELARHNPASTFLYGRLTGPGTPASMFTWEIGAIVTVLAAVAAVLVAIAVTRAEEDDGMLELLRSCGLGGAAPLRGALAVLVLTAALWTLGCTAAVGVWTGHTDGVTWSGAVAFGAVVGLTFLVVAVLAVALAQVAPSAAGARVLGFTTVGVAFAIRAVADTRGAGRLNWLTPLGLRATVRPFAENRWWVLAVYGAVALALAGLAVALSGRREYGAGLVRRRDRRDTRLIIRSGFGLAERLARRSVIVWTVAVACVGTMFAAMGSAVVQQSRDGDLGGFLASQLGTGDPTAAYFATSGTVIGLTVSTFAVLCVLRNTQEETAGLTAQVLAAGTRRWAPLAWQVVVTALGSAVVLVATGALTALVAPTAIDGPHVAVRAFGYAVGQWPAATALAGWTALLAGLRPRLTWLAWIPLIGSGVLALLGPLLGVPARVRDLGVFQHVPDAAAAHPDLWPLLVLLALAAAAAVLGVAATTRRDLTTG
ncbi:hypothetical protein [Actinacidiphila acididurans]|uniref:ABC transporter permease n=1 Tax=Actinacidiphila acididurans TaxID=2784346 RepID=A0ABS2TZA9_9ACTN|nr:hypothetical protein [Actinacidiphila acididurans]MBM9507293.1 hypothetical protein [Actinacidiphila acididurans]